MSAGMLPDLMLSMQRVIGLGAKHRLDATYSTALMEHYSKRGCLVIDMDHQIEPVISAMPMLTSADMLNYIRMELLRSLVFQVSQVDKPVVFLNLRIGAEMTFVQDVLGNSTFFHLLTNESDQIDNEFDIPFLDVTQLHGHVLDSLL